MVDYELYEIKNNIGNSYYYCSSNFDVEYNNNLYLAKAINRTSIEQDNYKKDNITINASMFLSPLPEFFNLTTKDLYYIKLMNKSGQTIFYGSITNVEFDLDEDKATITCTNITSLLSAKIPKKRFTNSCNNDLFDSDCMLNKLNYKTLLDNTKFQIIDTRTISIDYNTIEKYYSNGIIIINNQKNMIMKHYFDTNLNKNVFKLFYNIIDKFEDISVIEFYPGCDKVYDTCKTKFNNNENFNGFPCVPNENVFIKFSNTTNDD